MPEVDPNRIGITGHSYGGKWAMFASCFNEKFACAVWSDPGTVFNEKDPNVNYWEPWYLGYEKDKTRAPGVITEEDPRTGAYKTLVEQKMDLTEVMALMAPRPFMVSGGEQDPPERWKALNNIVSVYKFLDYYDRIALTSRYQHAPTAESNGEMYDFLEYFLKGSR
jgi:dienelactone hydrolase